MSCATLLHEMPPDETFLRHSTGQILRSRLSPVADPKPPAVHVCHVDGEHRLGRCTAERRDHSRRRHGLLGHRLLRLGDRHAESGLAGEKRRPLHAVLQHGALLSHPRCVAHRPLSASGRHRHDGGRHRLRRLSRRLEPESGHDRRGAAARRLSHLHDWQVARHFGPRAPNRTTPTGRSSAASTASTARSPAPAASTIRPRCAATTR